MQFKRKRSPERPTERRRPDRTGGRQPANDARQNQAFSYYSVRSQGDFNVGRVARADQPVRKQPKLLQQIVVGHKRAVLVGIVVLIGLAYNMQLSTTPKVVALTTKSDAPFLRETAVYQKAAEAVLRESAANRNKLTVNAPAVASRLRAEFPELRDVSVSLPFFGAQPVVYVQPSSPAAVLSSSSGNFVVDENGRALIAASDAASDAERYSVPPVIDQSRLEVQVGQPAISRSSATFIRTAVGQLRSQGHGISRVVLPASDSLLSVYLTGKPYYIKFNLRDERTNAALLQAGTFKATADRLAGQGTTPGTYVDVRVAGRAYYK